MNDRILAQQSWLGCNGLASALAFSLSLAAAGVGAALRLAAYRARKRRFAD